MKLSIRLQAIANLIPNDSNVLDVGCDHALLDIYLALKNIKCWAIDNKKAPLIIAKNNIEKYHLEDKIKLYQCSGLAKLNSSIKTIVLSGLGTSTILDIIKKDLDKIAKQTIIISSNNNYFELRKGMNNLGFKIINEIIIKDRDKYYPIIVFTKGYQRYKKIELLYGPFLLKKKDEVFILYLKDNIVKLQNINKKLNIRHFLLKYINKKEIRKLRKLI